MVKLRIVIGQMLIGGIAVAACWTNGKEVQVGSRVLLDCGTGGSEKNRKKSSL
jgi:hypothetical protein